MRIWKNDYRGAGMESRGYSYHPSKREARKAATAAIRHTKDDSEPTDEVQTEPIEVTPTKKGIISALNQHGGHPDNG
ncbi:MAG: hypothetical protein ABFD89_06855 [Bryobacteraceae bacterium]